MSRHYHYYLALAERHGTDQRSGAGRQEHLARLDAEVDNLHAALAGPSAPGRGGGARAVRGARPVLADARSLRRRRGMDRPALRRRRRPPRAACARPLRQGLALWPLGRARPTRTHVEAATVARELADPRSSPERLQSRALHESMGSERVAALADEALHWATAAGDEWQLAMACELTLARGASTAVELRERVNGPSRCWRRSATCTTWGFAHSAAWVALHNGDDRDAIDFADRALPVVPDLDIPFVSMLLHGNLALASLFTGDTDTARDAFDEGLRLSPASWASGRRVRRPTGPRRGRHRPRRPPSRRASRRRRHRPSLRHPHDPVEARPYARFLAPARPRHGTNAWDAAIRDGGVISFEDAIAYALQEPRA